MILQEIMEIVWIHDFHKKMRIPVWIEPLAENHENPKGFQWFWSPFPAKMQFGLKKQKSRAFWRNPKKIIISSQNMNFHENHALY